MYIKRFFKDVVYFFCCQVNLKHQKDIKKNIDFVENLEMTHIVVWGGGVLCMKIDMWLNPKKFGLVENFVFIYSARKWGRERARFPQMFS